MPGSVFAALAALKYTKDELCGFFITAVVETIAASDKVVDGACKFLGTSDIAALQSGRKKAALAANEMIATCRSVL